MNVEEQHDRARAVFAGLTPTPPAGVSRATAERPRLPKGVKATVPIVLAGAMAVSLNLAGPVETAEASEKKPSKPKSDFGRTVRDAVTHAATAVKTAASSTPAPVSYTVKPGDTVSSIAGRYGLSTASVLALNGLGWKSLIFPGQVLKLTPGATPAPSTPTTTTGGRYTIQKGDTISRIAARFGVSTQSVLTANGLGWSSIIYPGQTIAIPGTASLPVENVSNVTPVTPPAPPPPPADPVVPPAPPTASTFDYVIKSGDTVSAIAQRFGVSIQSILDANGLSLSSTIYAGKTLKVPGAAPVAGLTAEQSANAALIVRVGRSLGVSDRGIIIALATAAQESSLRNLNYGDRDSLGLFQQRPSTGWGTAEQIMDPVRATTAFFGGASNPNKGKTRGLLDIAGWESLPLTVAAQKVQISAYPDAYAKWEAPATAWLAALS